MCRTSHMRRLLRHGCGRPPRRRASASSSSLKGLASLSSKMRRATSSILQPGLPRDRVKRTSTVSPIYWKQPVEPASPSAASMGLNGLPCPNHVTTRSDHNPLFQGAVEAVGNFGHAKILDDPKTLVAQYFRQL